MSNSGKISPLMVVLSRQDRMKMISCLSGLLLRPEVQGNTYRIETMIGMTFLMSNGHKKPSKEFIGQFFSELGNSWVGRQEDPSEDIFSSNIVCTRGNFRILNGLWPGSSFYLKIFLEILDHMPHNDIYESIRQSCYSLLVLSEALMDRSGVLRNIVGEMDPHDSIPLDILKNIRKFKNYNIFSDKDLKQLGIEKSTITPFTINRDFIAGPEDLAVGSSALERFPIIQESGLTYLAVPTAVSIAIRNLIITTCFDNGLEEALTESLMMVTKKRLWQIHRFGGPHEFQKIDGMILSESAIEFDKGYWAHIIGFMDDFSDYFNGRSSGVNPNTKKLEQVIPKRVKVFVQEASKKPGFRGGMTLLVGCGWGRGILLPISAIDEGNWKVSGLAIHDLETMSWLQGCSFISLWKTLDMEEQIRRAGASIMNINGLLNLIGWERHLEGHQVPHAELPIGFSAGPGATMIQIPTTELRDLRKEAAEASDPLMLRHPNGDLVKVYRTDKSYFEFDNRLPSYASLEFTKAGRLFGVCVPRDRPWWLEVKGGGSREQLYQFWEMMLFWLRRISQAIESLHYKNLSSPVLWTLIIEDAKRAWSQTEFQRPLDPSALYDELKVSVDLAKQELTVTIPNSFQPAFFHPENHAERMLVRAFLAGSLRMVSFEYNTDFLDKMVDSIVPGQDARHIHLFLERSFRDSMIEQIPSKYIKISRQDVAWISFGLVDKGYSTDIEGFIRDKDGCKALLNLTVKKLEKKLADALKLYSRAALIVKLIMNYESIAIDKERWRNTAKALLALNKNKDAAMDVILTKESKRNAAFMATRIVIEAANCECQISGIETPSEIDVSRLLAIASSIFFYGGWSDAIHWGMMEPTIKISPYGDLMTKHHFEDNIVNPYGREGSIRQVEESISEYEKKYDPITTGLERGPYADPRFLDAWKSEFGVSLENFPKFMEVMEYRAHELSKVVFLVRQSELLKLFLDWKIEEPDAKAFLHSMTFVPRSTWWDVPIGFLERDRQAWRFRRRLSVLRFPIIQIDLEIDPTLVIAPSLIVESIGYLIWGFQSGSFPDKGYPFSDQMRSWLGTAGHLRGNKFNKMVSERLREIGWETESDLPVGKLMQSGLGQRNYGDVDVLAWDIASGRVLVIECKDLIFSKTYGEICQQMVDYLGDVDSRGRSDLLMKHLDRVDVIKSDLTAVKRYVKMEAEPVIESHIVFHNQVPMNFAWDEQGSNTKLWQFSDIDGIEAFRLSSQNPVPRTN